MSCSSIEKKDSLFTFFHLPAPCLKHCFSFLPVRNILCLQGVCKYFLRVVGVQITDAERRNLKRQNFVAQKTSTATAILSSDKVTSCSSFLYDWRYFFSFRKAALSCCPELVIDECWRLAHPVVRSKCIAQFNSLQRLVATFTGTNGDVPLDQFVTLLQNNVDTLEVLKLFFVPSKDLEDTENSNTFWVPITCRNGVKLSDREETAYKGLQFKSLKILYIEGCGTDCDNVLRFLRYCGFPQCNDVSIKLAQPSLRGLSDTASRVRAQHNSLLQAHTYFHASNLRRSEEIDHSQKCQEDHAINLIKNMSELKHLDVASCKYEAATLGAALFQLHSFKNILSLNLSYRQCHYLIETVVEHHRRSSGEQCTSYEGRDISESLPNVRVLKIQDTVPLGRFNGDIYIYSQMLDLFPHSVFKTEKLVLYQNEALGRTTRFQLKQQSIHTTPVSQANVNNRQNEDCVKESSVSLPNNEQMTMSTDNDAETAEPSSSYANIYRKVVTSFAASVTTLDLRFSSTLLRDLPINNVEFCSVKNLFLDYYDPLYHTAVVSARFSCNKTISIGFSNYARSISDYSKFLEILPSFTLRVDNSSDVLLLKYVLLNFNEKYRNGMEGFELDYKLIHQLTDKSDEELQETDSVGYCCHTTVHFNNDVNQEIKKNYDSLEFERSNASVVDMFLSFLDLQVSRLTNNLFGPLTGSFAFVRQIDELIQLNMNPECKLLEFRSIIIVDFESEWMLYRERRNKGKFVPQLSCTPPAPFSATPKRSLLSCVHSKALDEQHTYRCIDNTFFEADDGTSTGSALWAVPRKTREWLLYLLSAFKSINKVYLKFTHKNYSDCFCLNIECLPMTELLRSEGFVLQDNKNSEDLPNSIDNYEHELYASPSLLYVRNVNFS